MVSAVCGKTCIFFHSRSDIIGGGGDPDRLLGGGRPPPSPPPAPMPMVRSVSHINPCMMAL